MAAYVNLSEQAPGLAVTGPEDATLLLNTWPDKYRTAIVTVFNNTDDNAFICAPGSTGGQNGRLIPAGGSLTTQPIRRSDGALVIHALGTGTIYYSYNLIGSEG